MVKALIVVLAGLAALTVAVRVLQPRFAFFPMHGEEATPSSDSIPFQASTVATTDREQLRGWFLPRERARAMVVYFHGNGGNLSEWLPILAGIHRAGFSVAAIDYRGYGLSTGSPSEKGLYRDVDAALEWAVPLRPQGVPLVFWGRSLGTTMAAYAATHTRPQGLILESGFPDMGSVIQSSWFLRFLSLFSSYRFPTAQHARQAGCPVLVLHGDADHVIPLSAGRALYDRLPEPKWFEVMPGADHNDAVPPNPRRYWGAIDEFVGGLR